jgi:hypothetical protein
MKAAPKKQVVNNLVAKHANKFCRAATHKNKKTDYTRTMRNQGSKKNWPE